MVRHIGVAATDDAQMDGPSAQQLRYGGHEGTIARPTVTVTTGGATRRAIAQLFQARRDLPDDGIWDPGDEHTWRTARGRALRAPSLRPMKASYYIGQSSHMAKIGEAGAS